MKERERILEMLAKSKIRFHSQFTTKSTIFQMLKSQKKENS